MPEAMFPIPGQKQNLKMEPIRLSHGQRAVMVTPQVATLDWHFFFSFKNFSSFSLSSKFVVIVM